MALQIQPCPASAAASNRSNARDPFSLLPQVHSKSPSLTAWAAWLAERVLGLHELKACYAQAQSNAAAEDFVSAALASLEIQWRTVESSPSRVPESGGLIVVANHPFGALEGLAIAAWLRRQRADIRIVANSVLGRIPEFREMFIPIDPFGGKRAIGQNVSGLRRARRWLLSGGALVIFPAGEVAHLSPRTLKVEEPEWKEAVAWLAVESACPVLPVFIEGRNSAAFQVVGNLHPSIRTGLLGRELLNKRGATVRLNVGTTIEATSLQRIRDRRAIAALLRHRTLGLSPRRRLPSVAAHPIPVGPAMDPHILEHEIGTLGPDALLVESGEFRVYCTMARTVPIVMAEIARLRELSFRDVGEGTGNATDQDEFDDAYLQLFLWHHERKQIVGAYRLGLADRLIAISGLSALYTHSLFRYERRLLEHLGPAIELGRSFVVPAFQRSYAPLMLLWKGIGRFVALHPEYRRLFGAVSISNRYDSMTRRLMIEFLRRHAWDASLESLTHPVCPPTANRLGENDVHMDRVAQDVGVFDDLVRIVEASGRGIPVLLRQYLKLNARLLGFNIDRKFGDCLDGLFYVDLMSVPRSTLERYLGRADAGRFIDYHSTQGEPVILSRTAALAEAAGDGREAIHRVFAQTS